MSKRQKLKFDLGAHRAPTEDWKLAGESTWAFMNRCDRHPLAGARKRWNALVDLIPEELLDEFTGRLLAKDEASVFGAFAELVLLDALLSAGADARLTTPLEGKSRPDIEIGCAHEPTCRIEVAVRLPDKAIDQKGSALHYWLKGAEKYVQDPRVSLFVHAFKHTSKTASRKKLAKWVNGNASRHGERLAYSDGESGWYMEATIHVRENATPQSLFGTGPVSGRYPDSKQILDGIWQSKRDQHRESEVPVVVAVAWNDFISEPPEDYLALMFRGLSKDELGKDSLIWMGPCWPWGDAAEPVLWHTGSSPPVCLRWWRFRRAVLMPE